MEGKQPKKSQNNKNTHNFVTENDFFFPFFFFNVFHVCVCFVLNLQAPYKFDNAERTGCSLQELS